MSIATAINKNRCIYFGLEPRRTSTTRRFADDPFLARFGHQLPRGLRQEARGLQWRTFAATYSPAPDLRLQFLSEEKLPGGVVHYTAAIKTRSGETHHDIIASGPVQAATQLLDRKSGSAGMRPPVGGWRFARSTNTTFLKQPSRSFGCVTTKTSGGPWVLGALAPSQPRLH